MKKTMTAAVLAATLALVGCGVQPSVDASGAGQMAREYEEDMDLALTHSIGPFIFSVPESWEELSDPNVAPTLESPYEKRPSVGGVMQVGTEWDIDFVGDGEAEADSAIERMENKGTKVTSEIEKDVLSSAVTYTVDIEREQDGESCKGFAEFILSGHEMCAFLVCVPEADYDAGYDAVLEKVRDSFAVNKSSEPLGAEDEDAADTGTSAPEESEKSESEEPQADEPRADEPADTSMTVSQTNALRSARSYISIMDFSHSGLVDQLEYEGYSTEDAIYAADNCGADWNAEALGSARSYIDTMAFSYSGLIDQLEYEGFTIDQATYGANNCGADWNAEAAESAQSYLDVMAFSRAGLIDQLLYEGFTYEQAEYGVSTTGL